MYTFLYQYDTSKTSIDSKKAKRAFGNSIKQKMSCKPHI